MNNEAAFTEPHEQVQCFCGYADCMNFDFGYPFCRSCGEHHRPPECPVDEQGRALSPWGEPWDSCDKHGCDELRIPGGYLCEAHNQEAMEESRADER